MDQNIAVKNVKDFTDVLERHKVRWFLSHGTCLGALREGNIIGHDKDTDVGIMADDFNYRILKDLLDAGFYLGNIFGMRTKGMEISFSRDKVKVDLSLYYKIGDNVYTAFWNNGCRNGMDDIIKMVWPANVFESYTQLSLAGYTMKAPGLIDKYITSLYGPNWMTPVVKWDWRKDFFNIQPNFKI